MQFVFSLSQLLNFLIVSNLVSSACALNLAYFKMYTDRIGEVPAMEFNSSQAHLTEEFQLIMANTQRICVNGLWSLYEKISYGEEGISFKFGQAIAYQQCIEISQDNAIWYASTRSLRLVGPQDLDQVSLRTYTGTYYSGIESVIDGRHPEDRNLRGYIESFVITGPRNQHPDNFTSFIPSFLFYSEDRFQGRTTCIIMKNDVHGNSIPPKSTNYASVLHEGLGSYGYIIDTWKFGSVKLISYSQAMNKICPGANETIHVPQTEASGTPTPSYSSASFDPVYQSYGYQSQPQYRLSYSPTGYQAPSYEPSYQAPSYQPSYQSPAYQAPSYEPSYQPSYYPTSTDAPPAYKSKKNI